MIDNSSNLLINEEELQDSDAIEIYKELIRLIERDIDNVQSKNSREGLNIWGVLGGIVGAALFLLSQTKDISDIPPEAIPVAITSILIFQTGLGLYNVLSRGRSNVKERRLKDSKEVFKEKGRALTARFFILIGISIGVFFGDYLLWLKVVSIILILFPILFLAVSFVVSKKTQVFIGNNPTKKISDSAFGYTTVLFYVLAIVLLGSSLKLPIGQNLSAAYSIGLSVGVAVFLIEFLFINFTSTSDNNDLFDLKDDIVFRRASLNEALSRYRILIEGRTLFDEMKDDFYRILNYLNQKDEILNEQTKIIKKITDTFPSKDESELVLEDKYSQFDIFTKAIQNYDAQLNSLFLKVKDELNPFYTKLKRAADASGDHEAEKSIGLVLNQKIVEIDDKFKQLNSERNILQEKSMRIQKELVTKKD